MITSIQILGYVSGSGGQVKDNPEKRPRRYWAPGSDVHSRTQRRRPVAAMASAIALVSGLVLAPTSASAYTTTGCKWSSPNLTIDVSLTNGVFRTAINSALNNYTLGTDVNLTSTTSTGPSFTARNTNYGATGWEGQNYYVCPFGNTTSSQARINQYYLFGTSDQEGRIRVVWLHEIGHGLGLHHVTSSSRVMYTSASQAFFNGVRNLTSDEVAGINSLY